MYNLYDVASYIYFRYKKEYAEQIDEMKFHKVMYFSQRESLIQTGNFLFDGTFYGWKFGHVLKEIRSMYMNNDFHILDNRHIDQTDAFIKIMDKVFSAYVPKSSWTLSMISHNETSWKNTRIGIPDNANGDNIVNNDDIRADAERIKFNRMVNAIVRGA